MRDLQQAFIGAMVPVIGMTTIAAAGDLSFTNVTASAGVTASHSAGGYSHANYTGGGTVGDFNLDGYQDLLVLSGGGGAALRDYLFINQGDGTFDNEAIAWGLTATHKGKGASIADFNNDCYPDIFITSAGPAPGLESGEPGHHKLYRNNGNGTFTNIAASAGVNFTATEAQDGFGSTWGDYDLDGDLDLLVAGFLGGNVGSKLFRNNGDETFTDVTTSIGLFNGVPTISGFAPRFQDTDGDWYPELLFVGDFGSSRYFRNNADGTFSDISGVSGTTQEENGMGGTVGDFDGNGLIDWYVSSIYFPTIGWTGNKLYLNQGNHTFTEVAAASGCNDGGYGWGCLAIDFNHDRKLDIAETNGANGSFDNEQTYLWMQQGAGHYMESAVASGLSHFGQGRGMSNFDYDNDGDQDVVIFSNNGPLMMLRNDLDNQAGDANWFRVFLDTHLDATTAPNGHGAKVTVRAGETLLYRWMTSGDNLQSHSELSVHFGLGDAVVIEDLRVDYPNGESRLYADVAINQTMTITLGSGSLADINGDNQVNVDDLIGIILAWGQGPVAADVNQDGMVNVDDLVQAILDWGPVQATVCP